MSCSDAKSKQEAVFKQLPEIQEIKPEKPVKIKLKRNAKDDYSWEISGDDVNEIVKTDRGLRKGLKTE
jgi:predicted secreted protein